MQKLFDGGIYTVVPHLILGLPTKNGTMTYKQQLAINKVVENGGNVSKAMRNAGYSKNTAKTPSKLTASKTWTEYVDMYLPDEMLLEALYDDIHANKGNKKDYWSWPLNYEVSSTIPVVGVRDNLNLEK